MLTMNDDMKETISEIANALQTVDLLSTRLRQNWRNRPNRLSIWKAQRSERCGR